jgi:hypothetical protein
MAQIFHRSTNTISRASIFGAVFLLGLAGWIFYDLEASPYTTQQTVAREQPIQFSHAHHAGAIGIDCRYCHTSVEKAAFAGIPPTKTCMNCHSQIWLQSPYLEPVRESFRTDRSIEWTRVHDRPFRLGATRPSTKGWVRECPARTMPPSGEAARLQMGVLVPQEPEVHRPGKCFTWGGPGGRGPQGTEELAASTGSRAVLEVVRPRVRVVSCGCEL